MLANANNTPDIDELAGMLTRGEFPENYDNIIRNISDEDLERLWAAFYRMRQHVNEGASDPGQIT
ncbi:MAG TPA: hypothetical protein VEX68_03220 [Bryobacteraceae bacterium]|nr:hypothetical protein [Bryobacteraceae bacterium]